jgi:predicted GH43/DUF377 family glycosyl hydrolase
MPVICTRSFALATLLVAFAQQNTDRAFDTVRRLSDTPIIAPQGDGWESAGTFNPAVIRHDGKIIMLYRAQDKHGTSRLGYAESTDGVHFIRRTDPVLGPQTDYEKDGGVEDPRLVQFGDTYYLTYTGYNKKDAQLCLATSNDLIHWDRKGVIIPANKGNWNVKWTKSGAIVPEKINGKYWMYFLGTGADGKDQTGLASSPDLLHWTEETKTPVLPVRPGHFDSRVAEPGPPPIVAHGESGGIFLYYNGADDRLRYRTGVAVFDVNDPRKLLHRIDKPFFAPEKEWEKVGQIPNVVFVEGMIVAENQGFFFYYGAADKYVGVFQDTPRLGLGLRVLQPLQDFRQVRALTIDQHSNTVDACAKHDQPPDGSDQQNQ